VSAALRDPRLARGLFAADLRVIDQLASLVRGLRSRGALRPDVDADRAAVGGVKVPFSPILRRGGPIVLHDVHHLLTGYGFSWRGELEVAAWELGNGGCGWHVLYWLDRLTFFALGLVFAPRVTLRAFARGRRGHNLFTRDPEEVLRMDVDAARASIG
jgi:hypothetical protein